MSLKKDMNLLRKLLIVFFILFPISNSWGIISDEVQNAVFNGNNDDTRHIRALAFNPEGTKAFLHYQNGDGDFRFIAEFNLSTPFDISTGTYAGDSERCALLGNAGADRRIFDISLSDISSDLKSSSLDSILLMLPLNVFISPL